MNRQEKKLMLESVQSDFSQKNSTSFIVSVQGLTVEAVQGLRRQLRPGKMRVAKNTLLKLATKDVEGLNDLAPYFKNQIAVVFTPTDRASAIAKMLKTAAAANEKLQIIAGSLDNKVMSKADIEFLASLPTREVLLAQVCGTLKAPMATTAVLFNQMIVRLLWVLKQVEEKKQ